MKRASIVAIAILVSGTAAAQSFVVDNSLIPQTTANTENVDFGDVDLDGDWDVALAQGGDLTSDQNDLWINQGGAQGGQLGLFLDVTATQLPAVIDESRDVEFADIDDDGDLDLHTSNSAQQGSRWWVNQGGQQGGTAGFFADETGQRWVGLGVFPSSVPPGLILPDGSFKDWSCDSDFGDLDNDGDLDLVHSSYGGSFSGLVPTRIFLNNGNGFFFEFNPSGFAIPVDVILPGDPALWADGVQQHETLDTTGAFADIATTPLDLEIGDVDGDLDLDVLLGARDQHPRLFANRLEGSGLAPAVGSGQLGFRDVTGLVFPAGYAPGTGHYDQEMGDLDGDGDLDFVGVNWTAVLFAFDETVYENDGGGIFTSAGSLPNSGADDIEGDLLDYDNDGDLDVILASFANQDRLYRNDGDLNFTEASMPTYQAQALDIDACDTDGDGDYDVLVAEDALQPNTFLRNVTGVPDTTAPVITNLEDVSVAVATSGRQPVRAHVYDNAPYYITWYDQLDLVLQVDGKLLPFTPMRSSGGQVVRGEIPKHLVGNAILYRVRAIDAYGNEGNSALKFYSATGDTGTLYGASTGSVTISAQSEARAGMELYVSGSGAIPGAIGFIGISTQPEIPPFFGSPPGLVLNIASVPPNPVFLAQGTASTFGHFTVKTPVIPPAAAGLKAYCQFVAVQTGVGGGVSSSQGLEMTILP